MSMPPHPPPSHAHRAECTRFGQQRVCTWLTENGGDPNAFDEGGETPMHSAVHAGHASVAVALERRGGDLDLGRRGDGKTPSQLAAENGEVTLDAS